MWNSAWYRRNRPGVVIGSHVDKAGIAPHVVNAIGIGAGNFRTGKVVPLHLKRLAGRPPLLAGIGVVAEEFFLFGVHRDHGKPSGQGPFHGGGDVPELCVPVRMVGSLLGFAIALEAVAQGMKNLGDLRMAGRVFLPAKLPGNRPRAFARPAQRRLRIAPRCALDHLLQGVHKPGIGDRDLQAR